MASFCFPALLCFARWLARWLADDFEKMLKVNKVFSCLTSKFMGLSFSSQKYTFIKAEPEV